jgi:5'-3' exonuclease
MGIPSFYRHLCKRFPRIIGSGAGGAVEWLCLDFNCAMYYVLRRMPPVSTASSVAAWESDFCEEIAAYMREIVTIAGPTRGVYVSCDGVVCAAKRRQQRLRRFKGPWQAEAEAAVRRAATGAGGERSSGWDQNALTPGSAFMARLGSVLTAAGASLASSRGLEVIVSTTAEAGEGEHKLLRHMRLVRPASCAIYGLDADLILLSMLLSADTGATVRLLREAQEFEREAGAGEWRCLDVDELMVALLGSREPRRIRDYVAAMSLLGNDFLPRSLTHTVRDDGIPMLIGAIQERLWAAGRWLIGEVGLISRTALAALLEPWAASEDAAMLTAVKDAARAARYPPGIGASPEETALREWGSQPTRWATLTRLFDSNSRGHSLRADWRDIYRRRWGSGKVSAYLDGVAWVWDYYSGRGVCQGWTFDAHLPPLWSDVVAALRPSDSESITAPLVKYPEPLPEWLHLLAVLPVDSVRTLLPPAAQRVVALATEYWPTGWSLFDVGRRQIWECEPVIPMIPEELLRSWIHGAKK